MAPFIPTYAVDVELSGPGAGWTDLIADVIVAEGIVTRHGIDGGGPLDRVATTGTASFALNNDPTNSGGLLGYYSLYHAATRSGWGLGIGCRIRITDPTTLVTRTRFVGRIDAINPIPGMKGPRVVLVIAVDWMDEAARRTPTPAVGEQVNRSWDQILTGLIADMPQPPPAVSLDAGAESFPYALDAAAQQPATDEFVKLANSEVGLIYQRADGTFRAEGRHFRMMPGTILWNLSDADLRALDVPSTRDDIINFVQVTTHARIVDASPTTIVYSKPDVLAIPAFGSKTWLASFSESGDVIGATDLQPPVPTTDYLANAQADGLGADVTSSVAPILTVGSGSVGVTIVNLSGSTVYLTFFQLRGKGIYDRAPVQYEASDPTSIAAHGEHLVGFDMPYQASGLVGQAAADYFLAKYGNPFIIARRLDVAGTTADRLTQIIEREISDKISVSESVTGLNNDFFINGIERRFGGAVLEATLTLAPAREPFVGMYWMLGTSTLGTDTLLAPF